MQQNNAYYRDHFFKFIINLVGIILFLIIFILLLLYQVKNRPLPEFSAFAPNQQSIKLTASLEPNLLPDTIIKWASKAAVSVYTYRFYETDDEIYAKVKPYFTNEGLKPFYNSIISDVIQTIRANHLNTNCAVNGQPVIANQGDFPGLGFSWRVQIPMVVTYESANGTSSRYYRVTLVISKVPTTQNPAGIGISQFSM